MINSTVPDSTSGKLSVKISKMNTHSDIFLTLAPVTFCKAEKRKKKPLVKKLAIANRPLS